MAFFRANIRAVAIGSPNDWRASAEAAAEEIRGRLGLGNDDPLLGDNFVGALGLRLRVESLAAARDGEDAILIPTHGDPPFTIVVDPSLSKRERWMASGRSEAEVTSITAATVRFRIAHEIGHTLFYDGDHPPRRRTAFSLGEESFCDAFARCLVMPAIPAGACQSASALMQFARDAGSSVEIAADVVVDHHERMAILGGAVEEGRAWVRFASGVPSLPENTGFRCHTAMRWGWEELRSSGLFWPADYPGVDELDGWTDGHQFLLMLQLRAECVAAA